MKRLLALALFVAVSGCATIGATPAQKVFAATQAYDVALTAAVAYKRLPACKVGGATLCSDPVVVKTLQTADNVAAESLKSAQDVVRGGVGANASSLEVAATWAQEAVRAFARITNQLKVN